MRCTSILLAACLYMGSAPAQTLPADSPSLHALDFLLGTWQAKTGAGQSGASAAGTYTFRYDLAGHAMERTSSADRCTGPKDFDCAHHDRLLLYVNEAEGGSGRLQALYLDSEGHVIHYRVTTPDPTTAVFLSDDGPGPRFRLVYHLQSGTMTGRFEGAGPGSSNFHTYLEWSGPKA